MSKCGLVLSASLTMASAAAFVGQWTIAEGPALEPHASSTASAPGPGFSGHPISLGPDLALGDMIGPTNWGGLGGIAAYSIGSTKCNVGTVPVPVIQSSTHHYIEADAIYRLVQSSEGSRIEQVGISWLFHGFCDLQQTLCGACQPACGGCCSALGIGCSSPNTSSRMGSQFLLGPRFQVTASTGVFVYPFATQGVGGDVIFKRIQVANTDLNPALNPGSTYFGEGLIIHPDDAQAGDALNNASYRRLVVGPLLGSPPNQYYTLSLSGSTVRFVPAIYAWSAADASVMLANLDVPSDGRFVVGYDVTDLGAGLWRYEFAIYNQNSHRSGQSFAVPVPEGVTISNIGFHGPLYHSGEPPDNQPWTATLADGRLTWATQEYSGPAPGGNELTAYALRFGTLYNFRFDADAPPRLTTATLGLFRPGTPTSMNFQVAGPLPASPCAADLDGSGAVDGLDLAALLGVWGPCAAPCPADLNHDGLINGLDLALLLGTWGPC